MIYQKVPRRHVQITLAKAILAGFNPICHRTMNIPRMSLKSAAAKAGMVEVRDIYKLKVYEPGPDSIEWARRTVAWTAMTRQQRRAQQNQRARRRKLSRLLPTPTPPTAQQDHQ